MGFILGGQSFRTLSGFSILALCGAVFIAPACGDSDKDSNPEGTGSGGSGGTTGQGGTSGSGSGGKSGSTGQGGSTGGTAGTTSGSGGDSGGETSVGGGGAGGNGGEGGGATNADLSCLGDPLPTTAADPISITGDVVAAPAITDATVEIFLKSGGGALDSSDTGSGNTFDLSVATGTDPLSAYLKASKVNYWDSYLDPGRPLVADLAADMALATAAQIATLATAAGDTVESGNGVLLVVVRDCQNQNIEGAVVTSDSTATARYLLGVTPSPALTETTASGSAIFFDVEPGEVTVNAEVDGETMREASTTIYADSLTVVAVGP